MKLMMIILLWVIGVECGRILSGDVWVDYANAGSMTELGFSFMLQSPIDNTDYIKVVLPFPLHASLSPAYPATEGLSLPSGLTLTYQLMDTSANILPTLYTCQVLTETIDSSTYFIRFYASDRKTLTSISSNQWYYILFTIQQNDPLDYQKSNSILQIQMSTVSSVWSNAMVYDDNLAFNFFQLASAPTQSITLEVKPYNYGNSGGYLLTQAEYQVFLDVNMTLDTYQFQENLKLVFLVQEENTYLWNGSCSSVVKTNVPTIDALDDGVYSCSVDTVNNLMEVILNPTALTTQTAYRFSVGVINPSIVVTDVGVEVRAVKEVSGVILSYGQAEAALNTNQIYVTYQQIFVGWGLRPDALLPFDAKVFRGDSATPTYMPYNSLSTKFSLSQDTSSEVELKIQISIPSQTDAFVLENGFTHNLPAFPNKEVQCRVEYKDDITNRKIGCTGVGGLSMSEVYEIGWKMFFPYDNYQSQIDCTSFGLLTIYTVQSISAQDNAFILGRGNDFLAFLKSSPDYYVIGRNQSYIDYMKTFVDLNLIVISSDFQEFLKLPESIIITNRPTTYSDKIFNDVYVIGQNLAFMTYLSLFNDLYIAFRLKTDSDIAKSVHAIPLVASSTPKNTLTIQTVNSMDWTDYGTNQNPLLSSTTATSGNSPGEGLRVEAATNQSLIFSLKAAYAGITSYSSAGGTVIDDNWSLQILINPKIKLNDAVPVLSESSATSLVASGQTIQDADAYNKYTLITLKGAQSNDLLTSFPVTATKTSFGLYPFLIQEFSSIHADENNFDIMIATTDGIDGPQNTMVYNGYFLINSFTMMSDVLLSTLNVGYVAYSHSAQMDGSKVPTLLRAKGSIAGSSNFHSLAIFFDKLTPFFSNYHNRDIYCHSTDGSPFCKFYAGAEDSADAYNYQTFSRIQVPLIDPTASFDVLIPVKADDAKAETSIYLGYITQDPTTRKKAIAYMEPVRVITHSGTATTTGQFGPDLTGQHVGSTISSMTLKAEYSGSVGVNSGDNLGGAFLYFSEWDYFGGSSISGWANGDCYKLSYLLYDTNYESFLTGSSFTYEYKDMKGVVCFTDSGNSVSAASLIISEGYIPSKWGLTLPAYGAYSDDDGNLLDENTNYMDVPAALSISDLSTLDTPMMGPSLEKSVGQWLITLPVAITDDVQLEMIGDSGSTNLPFSADGTCCVYVGSTKQPITCHFTSAPTFIKYTLRVPQHDLLPATTALSIIHYGLTTNSTYNTINFDLSCYSLVNGGSPTASDLLFEASTVPFSYDADDDSYIGVSALTLSDFNQVVNNKAAITQFEFNFNLLGKGLYETNRIRVDLGQYYIDNFASLINPLCKVYLYDEAGSSDFSHDWAAIDAEQGLNKLELWPKYNLINNNLTYNVKCINFVATSSPSPSGLSAMVVNTSADLTGQLSTQSDVALNVLSSLSTTNQVSVSKKYTIPSVQMEMEFLITSPGITTDSYMYIGFPNYYSNGLGPNIKCYSTEEIYCTVKDRVLTIQYLGTFDMGVQFTITVTGVSKPINYNSGTFYFLIDNDDDPTNVISSSTFTDSVTSSVLDTQNFPAFQILSFTQSSAYLREETVTITMDFYLPNTLPSITVGQSLFLIFPPNFENVLRFVTPTCTLNARGNVIKNYLSSCSFRGLRLKMPFLDDMPLNTAFSLTVSGIINPINPSSHLHKYSLEISDFDDSSIVAKTFSPHANFDMPSFMVNPSLTPLDFYTVQDGLVTEVITTANLQSKNVYIADSSSFSTSSYSRNVYLTPLNTLYSIPSTISLSAGQNPFPIRFSSLTSSINYIYFSKSGDADYYSNPPPLLLKTNKNYFTGVQMVESSFKLPATAINGKYQIGINLPERLYPMSEVNLTVTLSSSVGLALQNVPTKIKFYPHKTSATIDLYVNDDTLWKQGSTTNLQIVPDDSTTYSSSVSIPLTASAPVSSPTPQLTFSSLNPNLKSVDFDVKCSEEGRFIYHISRAFPYNDSACTLTPSELQHWLEQSSIDGLRVDETYYECEDMIGMINIGNAGTNQPVTINNLFASTQYDLVGYCLSQVGGKSDLKRRSFETTSNGGYVSKVYFYFQSELTTTEKIKLVCALALHFGISYTKISTADGYFCSELLSTRLLTQTPRLLTSGSQVAVYFGVNNQLNTDSSPSLISSESTSQTNIRNALESVVGLPTLLSMNSSETSYVGSSVDFDGDFNVDVGPTYVYVEGMKLTNDGIIYVIIGEDELWPRQPTISEIKKGSGPNGLPPVYYRVLAYRPQDKTTGYVAYTGVGDKTLKMYMLPSNDNPFDTANFGTMKSETINAEKPLWQAYLVPLMVWLCLMMMY